jgi:hypothetical protein
MNDQAEAALAIKPPIERKRADSKSCPFPFNGNFWPQIAFSAIATSPILRYLLHFFSMAAFLRPDTFVMVDFSYYTLFVLCKNFVFSKNTDNCSWLVPFILTRLQSRAKQIVARHNPDPKDAPSHGFMI